MVIDDMDGYMQDEIDKLSDRVYRLRRALKLIADMGEKAIIGTVTCEMALQARAALNRDHP